MPRIVISLLEVSAGNALSLDLDEARVCGMFKPVYVCICVNVDDLLS